MREPRFSMALLLVSSTVSCSSPSGPCDETGDIRGEWTYQATQDAPAPATLHGSMVISTRRCADFQGAIDIVEVLPTGESRRVSGPVSGTVLDSTLIRFEAVVGGATREHLARLRADSITGDWIQALTGGAASGRFAGQRVGPP
jgi:hypothetical protein